MNNLFKKTLIAACGLACLIAVSSAPAAEYGSLKGRFVVDGKVDKPAPLSVDDKDPFCKEAKPENLALVVSEKGELADAVVYLRVPRGKKLDGIHPDYEAKLKENAVLTNKGCAFVPHVTLVRVGQTLDIKNDDPTGHNTNIAFLSFNQTIVPPGASLKVSAESPLPAPVMCNIHPFMKGYILSQNHPYMAVSAEDGTFEIKNIPAGKHEFQLWHTKYLKGSKFKGGAANAQGRAMLTIAPGETLDLGDIKVPAAVLK